MGGRVMHAKTSWQAARTQTFRQTAQISRFWKTVQSLWPRMPSVDERRRNAMGIESYLSHWQQPCARRAFRSNRTLSTCRSGVKNRRGRILVSGDGSVSKSKPSSERLRCLHTEDEKARHANRQSGHDQPAVGARSLVISCVRLPSGDFPDSFP